MAQRKGKPATASLGNKLSGRISLNMIVKDEADFIGPCLSSVKDVVDEVVVVDTGSSDATPEIARSLGAQVFSFEWCDDFSAARNEGLRHCTGDWVLTLDADESLDPVTKQEVRRAIEKPKVDLWYVRVLNLLADGAMGHEVWLTRLFRRVPGMRYVGRIHEQLEHNLPKAVAGHSDARILHRGYHPDVMRSKDKNARNSRLLELALRESENGPPLLRSSYLHYWAMAALGAERLRRFAKFAEYIEENEFLLSQRAAWIPSGLVHYAVALRNDQRPREAAEIARTLLDRVGEAPHLHTLLAFGALAEGRLEDAATEIDHALNPQAKFELAHREYVVPNAISKDLPRLALAQLEEQRRRWPEAEEAYRRLLANHESARPRLAYVQVLQGRYKDALATIEQSPSRANGLPAEVACLALVISVISRSAAGLLWWGEIVRGSADRHPLSAAIVARIEQRRTAEPFSLDDFPELCHAFEVRAPN